MGVRADRRLPEGEVTLLFTDIEGSTRLLHEIGDLYGDVLADHDRVPREVWEGFGGVVVDTEGDAFFVAFSDAGAAIDAAAAAQPRLTDSFNAMNVMSVWGECAMARGEFATAVDRFGAALRQSRGMPLNELYHCIKIAAALAGLARDQEAIELITATEAATEREGVRWLIERIDPQDAQLLTGSRARLEEDAVAQARRLAPARESEALIDWAQALAAEYETQQAI